MTSPFFLIGEGPNGFAFGVNPLPLATHILLFKKRTLVGYQPVGINPIDLLFPIFAISKTARQLLSALAINNLLFFLSIAKLLVVEPLGAFGYNAASKISTTFFVAISIMETLLSLALHTNKCVLVMSISLGLSPTVMGVCQVFVFKSNTKT